MKEGIMRGNTEKRGRVLFDLRSEVVSHWALVAPKGGRDPSNPLMELSCRTSVLRNCPFRVNAGMEEYFLKCKECGQPSSVVGTRPKRANISTPLGHLLPPPFSIVTILEPNLMG
jgi:hypothetical protein